MAQPTVTARPATWSGTSGPILYKFTSTNYAEAGYYMAVEIWDSVAAAKIADAKYYANSSGSVTVDVSAFLKSSMSLDLEADLTSGTVYTDGNWVKYYIKYQEIWTASSESQVDDVANLRFAIYGGLQLGVINDFTDYTDIVYNFLTSIPEGCAILNYPFLISFIGHEGSYFRVVKYLNGTPTGTTDTEITDTGALLGRIIETGTNDRADVSIISNLNILASEGVVINGKWTNVNYAGTGSPGTAWTLGPPPYVDSIGGFVGLTTGATSKYGVRDLDISVVPGVSYDLELSWRTTATTSAKDYTVYVAFLDASNNELAVDSFTDNTFGSLVAGSNTFTLVGVAGVTQLAVRVSVAAFGSGAFTLSMRHFEDTIDYVLSEVKTISIKEDCTNVVMLAWRNSLGGWESYPFTYNQEYTWHYSGRKAKRLTLYADNLTLSQWEAIQGLNTLGDLYRSPITEMTTSLNRTSATIGQSVYVLNSDGTKIGVTVIGQPNTTFTKRKKHSAFVTIEYPELFLQ